MRRYDCLLKAFYRKRENLLNRFKCLLEHVPLIAYYLHTPVKRRVEKNLLSIIPALDAQELRAQGKSCFKSLGSYALGLIRFIFNRDKYSLVVENVELISESSNPAICLSGHFCGFDFTTMLPKYAPIRMINIYDANGMNSFMQHISTAYRGRDGAECVPSGHAYRRILREIHQKGAKRLVIGALADVEPTKESSITFVNFCNKRRPFINGIIKIGVKIKADFYYASITPLSEDKYSLRFRRLTNGEESVDVITQEYASALEQDIDSRANQWLPIFFRTL